ncbi:MAG: efflux RND transporter permease subunit [Bacteroidia bacterium]
MWKFLANKILRHKIAFASVIALITVFMSWQATKIELTYEYPRILPSDDPTWIDYDNFKKMFGEDGSIMVIGMQDTNLYQLDKFNDWYKLGEDIKNIEGIRDLMSVGKLYNIKRNDSLNRFDFPPVISRTPKTQAELDSVKEVIMSLPFYDELVYNKKTGATLMAITFQKKELNSKTRIEIVNKIKTLADAFGAKHHVELHFSGMPYIRTAITQKVSGEMGLFMALALIVMVIILSALFRSFNVVFFSVLVTAIGVVWSLGTIALFGYKITMLSGLIAPLIMVIGIPNCVFLFNKYQSEYSKHGNKQKALSVMIQTIGVLLFLANVTTAIGFGVLYFTNSSMLVEFGVVAAINVMATYCITLILIPIIMSYLPAPSEKHTRHLEGKRINKVLAWVDYLVHNRRAAIYTVVTIVTILGSLGAARINVIGYVVDDLPQKDPINTDLHFFQDNFHGVLPFEVSIDTKKKNGVFADNAAVLYKIKRLQKIFAGYDQFSRPVSVVEGLKFFYQAYEGGAKKKYVLPGIMELKQLQDFAGTVKGKESKLTSFIDSTKQFTRVSFQMRDVGSAEINRLVKELQPRVDSIFDPKEYKVELTGQSLMFLKGNDYLLKNLFDSLLIEILLIAIVGIALFRSIRIILLSKLPCLIPLIVTAGIMGYLGIRFKPSTILIFSIAFGISSDGTIYFLTKYRQELNKKGSTVADAISTAIRETGLSMIYTAVILFCGFAIFAASSFGGTVAMGVLISLTLLVAMCTNLVLLPAILLSIDKRKSRREAKATPLIEV